MAVAHQGTSQLSWSTRLQALVEQDEVLAAGVLDCRVLQAASPSVCAFCFPTCIHSSQHPRSLRAKHSNCIIPSIIQICLNSLSCSCTSPACHPVLAFSMYPDIICFSHPDDRNFLTTQPQNQIQLFAIMGPANARVYYQPVMPTVCSGAIQLT